MMVLDKKEIKLEELNSVVGGNAVGPTFGMSLSRILCKPPQ